MRALSSERESIMSVGQGGGLAGGRHGQPGRYFARIGVSWPEQHTGGIFYEQLRGFPFGFSHGSRNVGAEISFFVCRKAGHDGNPGVKWSACLRCWARPPKVNGSLVPRNEERFRAGFHRVADTPPHPSPVGTICLLLHLMSSLLVSTTKRIFRLIALLYCLLRLTPSDARRASDVRGQLTHEGQALLDAAATNKNRGVRRLIKAFPGTIENRTRTSEATPLLRAAWFGHVKIVKDLVRLGANVDAKQFQGFTSLHYSAQKGGENWNKIADVLLRHDADIDPVSNDGYTPLYIASEMGHWEIVKKLLKAGAGVDLPHEVHGATPLMAAARNGQSKTVGVLLEQGKANQTVVDVDGFTALHRASRWGFTEVIEKLLDWAKSTEEREHLFEIESNAGATALYLATQENWLESVQLLLERGADPNHGLKKLNTTPLMVASEFGDVASIEALAKGGADLGSTTIDGRNALFIAAQSGHKDVVSAILDAGYGVNEASLVPGGAATTPFGAAILNKHWDVIEEFVRRGVDVNSEMANGIRPLWYAAKIGFRDLVDLLIERNAQVEGPGSDVDGVEPIMVAAYWGHASVIRSLVRAGGDVESSVDGWTCLGVAVHRGHFDVVNELLIHNANVDVNVFGGNTPLMIAARRGDARILKSLLKGGAEVELKNDVGTTALHFSVEAGESTNCVRLLLEFRAEVDALDDAGDTPLAHAAMYGNEHAIEVLLGEGANPALPNGDAVLPTEQICLCMRKNFTSGCASGNGCENSSRILEVMSGAGG
ncbi:LOW QUALITY PROTEIN: hypothetical protein BSKO_11176 [Bryopsis sp. KO-2023]|nr:LOW QUALITY PROTEIN: hypothetical protein BSKO_11176 [Bryopsis sp. KO-2023]